MSFVSILQPFLNTSIIFLFFYYYPSYFFFAQLPKTNTINTEIKEYFMYKEVVSIGRVFLSAKSFFFFFLEYEAYSRIWCNWALHP
jgi:hypothetical protein